MLIEQQRSIERGSVALEWTLIRQKVQSVERLLDG